MNANSTIWTPKMLKYLRDNYQQKTNAELAKALGLRLTTTRTKLYELGLYRMIMEYWTDEQIEFLKSNYKTIGDQEMAMLFNGMWEKEKRWSQKHIEKKRRYLLLKRTADEIEKIRQRNIKRGSFRSGSTWRTRGVSPDGTVRIWKLKTAKKHQSYFAALKVDGRYVHYGHWLYEKTFGKMPAGHVVGYKDRNNLNVVPENLEAITRAEHARRNAVLRSYPEDLREMMKVLNQLNNTINKKKDVRDKQQLSDYETA